MEVNYRLKKLILEVVDNQLRDNDPPITKETFNRLVQEGCSKTKAKEMIGSALAIEIYDMLKENKPHDEERYARNLEALGKK